MTEGLSRPPESIVDGKKVAYGGNFEMPRGLQRPPESALQAQAPGERNRLRIVEEADLDPNRIELATDSQIRRIDSEEADQMRQNFETDMDLSKYASLESLLSALQEMKKMIVGNNRMSEVAKENFSLDPDYNLTLADLIHMVETAQAGVENQALNAEEIKFLPLRFPDKSCGIRQAMEKIVENLSAPN